MRRLGTLVRSRLQLHMAHELARALQQAGRTRQRCAVKEAHVDVRREHIDVTEGRIAQACNRTAVMQRLTHFVPASSHRLKPLARDVSQFTPMLPHPRIDDRIALLRTVKPKQLRLHRRTIFAFDFMLPGPRIAGLRKKRISAMTLREHPSGAEARR